MKSICMWCRKHLRGDKTERVISHGICKECKDKMLKEIKNK
jgi:hypothetical protein